MNNANEDIVRKYEYNGKIFDTYEEACKYKERSGLKAWTCSGNPCHIEDGVATFILTTNIEQNEYAREKGIILSGTYGFYYFDERSKVWCRVPSEVVEEICRRFC